MLSWFRQDGLLAHAASGSEFVVEVFDAVNHVSVVDRKRNAVQTFATNDATEAVRVIGFACRSQNAIKDRSMAHTALFKCVLFCIGKLKFNYQFQIL